MKVISDTISIGELQEMADRMFGNMVKGVVDIEKNVLALDAEMHADEEQLLLKKGSGQKDLWGINLYPEKFGDDDFVEFDSMINLRPSQNNRSRGIDNKKIREKILEIVKQKIIA